MLLPLPVVPRSSTPATSLENRTHLVVIVRLKTEVFGSARKPGAVDTSGHDSLDERTNVLVLHCPLPTKLVVCEPRPVRAEGHRLVLQITFSTLEEVSRNSAEPVLPGHRWGSQEGG